LSWRVVTSDPAVDLSCFHFVVVVVLGCFGYAVFFSLLIHRLHGVGGVCGVGGAGFGGAGFGGAGFGGAGFGGAGFGDGFGDGFGGVDNFYQ